MWYATCVFTLLSCIVLTSGCGKKIANKKSKFINRILNYLFKDTKPLYIEPKTRSEGQLAAERYNKERMKFSLQQLCDAICITEWTPWSQCSKQCAGGQSVRTRKTEQPGKCKTLDNFRCRHATRQQRTCNPGCPNGGIARNGVCNCPDGWLGTCCRTRATCQYPGLPKFSRIQGTWPSHYGSVITYSCNHGYILRGEQQRFCQADQKWSKAAPTCKRVTCNRPPTTPRLIILNSQGSYDFEEEVIFMCEEGFSMRGPDQRKCVLRGQTGKWTLIQPTCLPIKCGNPGTPPNANRIGTNFTYGSAVSFQCVEGYHLSGSHKLECAASGNWLGQFPTCEPITCDAPFAPKNGRASRGSLRFNRVVQFDCDTGFHLVGNKALMCTGDGIWNGTEPVCEPVTCPTPDVPPHSSKDGSLYYHPNNITYSCFTGYQLSGARVITCQVNRQWTADPPTCNPCPKDTYMGSNMGTCTPCPANSHTITTATTSKNQCICNKGFDGPTGGPCVEIRCPELTAPADGSMAACDNKQGSTCVFDCNPGYILEAGSSMRTCHESTEWSGKMPLCSACPKGTYKMGKKSCLPCPPHSKTREMASLKKDCICDEGYEGPGGGPCTDKDECLANGGKGECSSLCQNTIGSYTCSCEIYGHKIDPKDLHSCIIDKQCTNLTQAEAPENGGLICHWYYEENSQQCTVKCNPGYEFMSRINNYETCGPSTGYIWSFRAEDPEAVFTPCIEEFFPEYTVEAKSSYFVRACSELTDSEEEAAKQQFAETLNEKGVCKRRGNQLCDVKSMAIICGQETIRRRRRGVEETLNSVDVLFDVNALKVTEKPKDCDRICNFLRIPERYCDEYCLTTYKRFLRAAVSYARRQLQTIYATQTESLSFTAANRTFEAEEDTLYTSDTIVRCPRGMEPDDDKCVPCERGFFLEFGQPNCTACPIGTFQPLRGMTACIDCPKGTTTKKPGAKVCSVCAEGKWGHQCNSTCDCVHGHCDPKSGKCICDSGWEGPTCETDTPGCNDHDCFANVTCADVAAPGTGYTCGACPVGLTGDGNVCLPMTLVTV